MTSSGHEPDGKRPGIERLWRGNLSWFELLLWAPLVPAAAIFSAAVALRNRWWRGDRRVDAGVATVSVGNLTVGGNAKTPFTLFLATRLAAQGFAVGIVSRGYGRRSSNLPAVLVSDGTRILLGPDEAGDEPLLMARSFRGPVAVAHRRIDGIRLLQNLGPLDFAILDDAFQHIRLKRDVDLLMLNGVRGFGNGWMLPAGPMREQISAIARATGVVIVNAGPGFVETLSARAQAILRKTTAFNAAIAAGAVVMSTREGWREVSQRLAGRRVLLVSGVADPAAFHATVHALGAEIAGALDYPDHYRYTANDWSRIAAAAGATSLIVTTEKDLVKLERFAAGDERLCALRLAVTMTPAEEAKLLAMILARTARAHSEMSAGSDTTT